MRGKKIIAQTFSVPFRHLHFHYGGVSCNRLVKELGKTISITIINYDVREEFDAVKDYFANALSIAAVDINLRIEAEDGVPKKIEATSPQIAAIDGGLIQTVRFAYVKEAVKKKLTIEVEKNMLTMEELFDAFSENRVKADTFYEDEKALADDMLAVAETKHYHHLRTLSARHAHHIMRLRFVLKPFSFLFLLEGEQHYHIVWETLDTEEATYVWPVPKDPAQVKLALKKVEEVIQLVKVQGKAAYLSSATETYRRIFHHYKDGIKGFVKWKGELESILT
ncbi:hypothetical protein HRG84_00540 [Flavisolibacter sp. BT320]|nr:hypothetical protein [Flavisolibacter longurius]